MYKGQTIQNKTTIVSLTVALMVASACSAVAQIGQQETVVPLPRSERGNARRTVVIRDRRPVSTLMVNGRPAPSDVDPQMIEGRVMVPIRFVAQELGAKVTWDPITRMVRLVQGNRTVTMTVGSTRADLNGLSQALAVAPVIRNGRTLLPLRDVARFSGGVADYNADTGVVFVTTAGGRGSTGSARTSGTSSSPGRGSGGGL